MRLEFLPMNFINSASRGCTFPVFRDWTTHKSWKMTRCLKLELTQRERPARTLAVTRHHAAPRGCVLPTVEADGALIRAVTKPQSFRHFSVFCTVVAGVANTKGATSPNKEARGFVCVMGEASVVVLQGARGLR